MTHLIIGLVLGLSGSGRNPLEEDRWSTDASVALAWARKQNRPILIYVASTESSSDRFQSLIALPTIAIRLNQFVPLALKNTDALKRVLPGKVFTSFGGILAITSRGELLAEMSELNWAPTVRAFFDRALTAFRVRTGQDTTQESAQYMAVLDGKRSPSTIPEFAARVDHFLCLGDLKSATRVAEQGWKRWDKAPNRFEIGVRYSICMFWSKKHQNTVSATENMRADSVKNPDEFTTLAMLNTRARQSLAVAAFAR